MENLKSQGFIRYSDRYKNGKETAIYCHAERIDGKKKNNEVWLGRVFDKEHGIFFNHERGFFRFTVENSFEELTETDIEFYALEKKRPSAIKRPSEIFKSTKILTFGSDFVLNEVLKSAKIDTVFKSAVPEDSDTLMSLIFYKLLDENANKYAKQWWNKSYSRYLFPKAKLESSEISKFYKKIGDEDSIRQFYYTYYPYLKNIMPNCKILIDSTGLPNSINFDLTKKNVHNGIISNEVRLILVMDKNTGWPIYFRYVPGNIVDVSTLEKTLLELKSYKIGISHAIVDAGYYSAKNIATLYKNKIPFLIRSTSTTSLYKNLIVKYKDTLFSTLYRIKYNDRILTMIHEQVDLHGHKAHAYIAMDIQRRFDEQIKLLKNFESKNLTCEEADKSLGTKGMFILLSSKKLKVDEVLPLYYTRQAIEQVFDYAKNDVGLLPLRSHGEDTFRGHLVISFMACIAKIVLNQSLEEKSSFSATSAIHSLNKFGCNVHDNYIYPEDISRESNEIADSLKIQYPVKIKCGV
jgi:hypothetical protein